MEDDQAFCPRLRWAEINNEDLNHFVDLKKKIDILNRVFKYLTLNPGLSLKEISEGLHMNYYNCRNLIYSLRNHNIEILSVRNKNSRVRIYCETPYRPIQIIYPVWSKYKK